MSELSTLFPECCRCSGDDALNACGRAAPVLRGCRLQAKRCGVRAYGDAAVALTDCVLEDCGEQGAKAFDRAALTLCRCVWVQSIGY